MGCARLYRRPKSSPQKARARGCYELVSSAEAYSAFIFAIPALTCWDNEYRRSAAGAASAPRLSTVTGFCHTLSSASQAIYRHMTTGSFGGMASKGSTEPISYRLSCASVAFQVSVMEQGGRNGSTRRNGSGASELSRLRALGLPV